MPEAFTVRLAGGAWRRRALGKDYDAFKGISCGEDVQRWRFKYHLPRVAHFFIDKFEEANARRLARTWASKMQHLDDVSGGPLNYTFTQADRDAFIEDPGLLAWRNSLPPGGVVARRLQAISALPPC